MVLKLIMNVENDKQLLRQLLHLINSNSGEIKYGSIKANDCKDTMKHNQN